MAWINTLNQGVVSPLLCAAIQYGIKTMRPTTADAIATPSHHVAFLNKPTVAMVKPTIVANAMTFVMDQARPLVETPLLANIGVSHKYVVPNKNKATPPRLRIVSIVNSTMRLRDPQTCTYSAEV